MVLIIILTFICVSFTQKYKVLLGESTFYLRLLLISLLHVDALTLNVTLSIYSLTETISIFGLFVVTFRSLVCQAIGINVSIFTIANLIINNRHKDPVRFVLGLCTKLLMKLMDTTLFVPLSIFASTIFHDIYNIKMSVLSSKELEELNEDMRVTLKQLNQISFSLQKMKMENKDLDLLLDKKGNLDIEVSENTKLSQEELSKLAQKVMISDRCYNSQLDKYKELVDKDVKQNNGEFSSVFNKHLDSIDSKYKQLFILDK